MDVNINIGDRGMLYIPIKKKNITIHINPEKWDVCEFVEEINPAMVYLLLDRKSTRLNSSHPSRYRMPSYA